MQDGEDHLGDGTFASRGKEICSECECKLDTITVSPTEARHYYLLQAGYPSSLAVEGPREIYGVKPVTVSPLTVYRSPREIYAVKQSQFLWPVCRRTQEIYAVNFLVLSPSVLSSPRWAIAH